jgi:hypothetical protein
MNHEFIIKMMKAKKMEYEALKEILPEKVATRISKLEVEVIDMVKDCVVSGFMNEEAKESEKPKDKAAEHKNVKKVIIES